MSVETGSSWVRQAMRSKIVIAELALLAFLLAVVAWQVYDRREDRVLSYPEQDVTNTLPGIDGPALLVTEDLLVTGRKCVLGDEPVPVIGILSWVSVDPAGSVLEVGRGSTTRKPGECTDQNFVNPVPPIVEERTRDLVTGRTSPCMTWVITGTEQPNDRHQAAETWTTEPFQLCVTAP